MHRKTLSKTLSFAHVLVIRVQMLRLSRCKETCPQREPDLTTAYWGVGTHISSWPSVKSKLHIKSENWIKADFNIALQ